MFLKILSFNLQPTYIQVDEKISWLCLSMLYKTLNNVGHPLHSKLPQFSNPINFTKHTVKQNY